MQMVLGGGILTDDMCNFEKVALNDQVEKRGRLKGSQWGGCICFYNNKYWHLAFYG